MKKGNYFVICFRDIETFKVNYLEIDALSMIFLENLYENYANIETVLNFTSETINIKIEFKNVSFKFKKDGLHILQNINLDIQSNQSICLSGFNHSGKSLLLELMAGIYKPDSGTITLNDYIWYS